MKRNEILKYEQSISIEMESKEARKHGSTEPKKPMEANRSNEATNKKKLRNRKAKNAQDMINIHKQ